LGFCNTNNIYLLGIIIVTVMAMGEVKSRDVAKANYLEGIRAIGGATKYYECGRKAREGPAIEVAKCLRAAKKTLSEEDWAEKWAKRMYGS